MKRMILSLFTSVVFLIVFVSFANSQEVQYLGKFSDRDAGVIRISGQDYEVSEGSVIQGWGTVKQITDTHLILQLVVSDEEKAELARAGAAMYDILEIHLPHEDLRVVTVP